MVSSLSFYKRLTAVSFVFFTVQLSGFIIFPFLPFMVSDFFPNLKTSELGKTAGYLGSAFFMGYIPGCLLLAVLADKIGRRPVLLVTAAGTVGCQLLFGFSLNFAWACISRALWGFFSGGVAAARTYVSEIADESNTGMAFAVVGSVSALGRISGSIIGGFLAQPASKYRLLQDHFFCKFAYLFPCIVGAAIGLAAVVCGIFCLDESLQSKKKKNPDTKGNSNESGKTSKNTKHNSALTFKYFWKIVRPMLTMKIIVSLLLFSLGPLAFLSAVELLPLLFVNNYAHGGYNMDDTEIGVLMLISSVAIVLTQAVLYSLIAKRIGYRWTFRISALLFAIFTIIMPFSTKITGPVPVTSKHSLAEFTHYCGETNNTHSPSVNEDSVIRIPWLVWLILGILYSNQTLWRVMYSTGTIVMFGNSSARGSRSVVNGVGQSLYGLSAIIAPIMSAPILAWSENSGKGWPLNFHFVFELVALFLFAMIAMSFLLPKSIEKREGDSKNVTPLNSRSGTPTKKNLKNEGDNFLGTDDSYSSDNSWEK